MRAALAVRRALPMVLAVVACMFVGCGGAQAGGSADDMSGVAAYYGDTRIAEDEVTGYTEDFRADNGLEEDDAWASYLASRSMDAVAWREEAIRQIVDEQLVRAKADEFGIAPDEETVESRISAMRDAAGIDEDDEQAWADYLADRGQTPDELRETLEYTSIEQQLLGREVDFTGEIRDEMCNDYIRTNLADQVIHRYSAIEFDLGDEAQAASRIAELAALPAGELQAAFDGGDIGWDFLYDEWTIDPDLKLRGAQLASGELLGEPLVGEDRVRVVLCTDRADFVTIDYASLESEPLKELIASLARTSGWSALSLRYLSELEAAAGVQVVPMPDGLPYALD